MSTLGKSPEFEAGWDDADAGKSETSNPHEIGSDKAMDWNDGFTAYLDQFDEDGK